MYMISLTIHFLLGSRYIAVLYKNILLLIIIFGAFAAKCIRQLFEPQNTVQLALQQLAGPN